MIDVPEPQVALGRVLMSTQESVVSGGTERMLLDFGRANLLEKARQHQDRVKDMLDKVCIEGLSTTAKAARSKLVGPIEFGYANAAVMVAVGTAVDSPALVSEGGSSLALVNSRALRRVGKRTHRPRLGRQDKDHRASVGSFIDAVGCDGSQLPGADELLELSCGALELAAPSKEAASAAARHNPMHPAVTSAS